MSERRKNFLFTDGNIITMAGDGLFRGNVLVSSGKIASVERADAAGREALEDVEKIDISGLYLVPGFIDAHCHVGMWEDSVGFEGDDGNEMTDPVTPELRAIDGIYPTDVCFKEALRAGVTTAVTGPGSANVICGQFAAVKTHGKIIDEMVIKAPLAMKVAFGENPKRVYSEQKKSPMTRMATASILRETLFKAQNYMKKKEAAADDPDKAPDFDFKLESLIPVLKREIPLKAHAHRADDIMTAIRIAEEFNLRLTLDHCTEGHLIADIIAKKRLPAIVGPSLTDRSKVELRNKTFETPGILAKAGILVAIMTDHPVTPLEYLPLCAKLAVKAGMTREDALAAITINAARICDIADRVGSIEKGKDADMVVFDGHPMDFDSTVKMVVVNGEIVYNNI